MRGRSVLLLGIRHLESSIPTRSLFVLGLELTGAGFLCHVGDLGKGFGLGDAARQVGVSDDVAAARVRVDVIGNVYS